MTFRHVLEHSSVTGTCNACGHAYMQYIQAGVHSASEWDMPMHEAHPDEAQREEYTLPMHEAEHDMFALPTHEEAQPQQAEEDMPDMLAYIKEHAWSRVQDAAAADRMPDLLGTTASEWIEYLPDVNRAAVATAFQHEFIALATWEQAIMLHGADASPTTSARDRAVRAAHLKHKVLESAMNTAKSIVMSGITDVTTEIA